jgi:hypothetical protein
MEAWERQAGESEEAFDAFQRYRELPPGQRSVVKVGQLCGKNPSLISRWSSRHHWVGRVVAFDAWVDQQRVSAQVQALTEMWRRQVSMALLGQQQALAWLQQVDPTRLRDEVGVRLFIEAARLERLARTSQVDEEVPGGEPAGPLRTLAELFAPAGPGEVQVSELQLARIVVERSGASRPEAEGLDLELAELVSDPEDGEDPDPDDDPDAAPWPMAAVVPEPDPEPEDPAPVQVGHEEPRSQEPREEPPRLVVEDGRLVQRRPPPPPPDPGWTPGPPPRRARHNGRR